MASAETLMEQIGRAVNKARVAQTDDARKLWLVLADRRAQKLPGVGFSGPLDLRIQILGELLSKASERATPAELIEWGIEPLLDS